MASKAKQKLKEDAIKDEPSAEASHISMPALTSLLEEHRQAISSAPLYRVLVEIFGDQVLQTPPELDRAHRTLSTKPRQGDKPRTVIVCFHRHQTKELVVRESRRRRNDLKYQGTPIRIYEDYSPDVLEQRAAYREVMAKLYNLGLRPALLYPARLQITDRDGNKRRFSSAGETATFVRSWSAS
ncbi:hypothetical protein SKAU_G00060390 [Synaphobranchus kaupii]|uniref:LINE-1 type transposase domain-containing 1 n=1 Tax=Synaphobranchus kaupii TaxID=118154 RepID=A0A9Q1G5W5_SYNKA|nr:hypothetical protein SKAU_G00060390 [Synaphobranchus kaupii]